MAFGFGKLAVLESKLSIYEDLSQQMLDKLEKAVGTISDNSNKIAIILERHENRLDESERTDNLIIKMIDELKEQEERIIRFSMKELIVSKRKLTLNQRFVIGVSAVIATVVTVLQVVPPLVKVLTPTVSTSMIGAQVSLVNDLRR